MSDPTKINIKFDPTVQRMEGYTAHKGLHFDVPFITEVADNLWQGGCRDGLVLPPNFKHLVSLYPWEHYRLTHLLDSMLIVKAYDALDQAVEQFVEIARWVNTCRETGPVLVHCQAGLNRSSLVTGLALVLNHDVPEGDAAVKLLREKRSDACLCNDAFEDALTRFHTGLYNDYYFE